MIVHTSVWRKKGVKSQDEENFTGSQSRDTETRRHWPQGDRADDRLSFHSETREAHTSVPACRTSMDAQHLFDLEGSIALVTGGGTGIGLMAAKTLAANGAKVYITGRRQNVLDNAIATHGQGLRGSMAAVPGDISSKEDLARIASSITEKKLHILIKWVTA